MSSKIAQVVVDIPVAGPFDYEVPSALAVQAKLGHRVLVSFQTKILVGYIVGFKDKSAFRYLKPVLSLLDKEPALTPLDLELAKEFSTHYCCSLGHAIAAFLPVVFKKTKKEIVFAKVAQPQAVAALDSANEMLALQDLSFKNFWPVLTERIQNALRQDLGVIILVPETTRFTPLLAELKTRGISEIPTIFDKKLKDKEQIANWTLIKESKARLVVGRRSAIFAPVSRLGLIVMFEEGNFSYKQDQSPFYHAREVALMRAKIENAGLVFVVRTLSVALYGLLKKKELKVIDVSKNEKPADVKMVDLSNYKYGKGRGISMPLQYAMEKTLAQRGKILLVMNKKGFGTFGACAKCHHVLKCPHCDIPLTFLYEQKKVVCRHCTYQAPCPSTCPSCRGAYINFSGMGIEKLESQVARLFPSAKIACYAKESGALPASFDILVATQAVTRFDDKARFDLTCVVDTDAELSRINFEAGENAFLLLRHLHAMTRDKFFIQTRLPDNYVLKALVKNSPKLFYTKEAALRRELHFPPFGQLAEIFVRSRDQASALKQAEAIYTALTRKKAKSLEISPPQVLSLARLRDQYRFVIVVRGTLTAYVSPLIAKTLASLRRSGKTITTVNVAP